MTKTLKRIAPVKFGLVLGIGLGLVFCFLIPIVYTILGGLIGMLMAWIYNVAAGWVGGIEVEVE